MREDAFFSFSDVYAGNFQELNRRLSELGELRISEIAALAREAALVSADMMADGFLPYEVISSLSLADTFVSEDGARGVMPENASLIAKLLKTASATDKSNFAALYTAYCKERARAFSVSDFFDNVDIPETFTYVKNSLADEAYDVFSQDFADPRVFYSESTKEAVKAVVQGRVGYALLPLEESGGVRLGSIEAIIYENDLKIAAVTPVFGFEGTADMKYALVCQSLSAPVLLDGDEGYVELRLSVSSEPSLSELLLAADALAFRPYKVRTTSFVGERGEPVDYYSVIFKDEENGMIPLFVYLGIFYPDCDVVGVYKNME